MMHVVQISRDGDLLRLPETSEPVQRQLEYARELARRSPGSNVTIVVLSPNPPSTGWTRNNVRVVAMRATVASAPTLVRTLYALHRSSPISVITTQVPYDEGWLVLALGHWCRIPVIAQIHSDLFAELP